MKHLRVSPDLALPIGIANRTLCIFGKGGSGKSNLEVVLAEELYAAGVPTCIVDPADIHYGIKSARDGKSAGLPFIVFGGLHADVPIYPENGALLADLFLDRGLYMVIVTQPWTGGERSRFMTDFANQLYKRGPEKEQRGSARVLMFEEAHEYVPLVPGKGEEVMLGAMKRLYTVGRNYWIGFIAATRRPAKMHTDLRNGADATAFFQIVGTHDRKAMTDYLGEMAEKDVRDEILSHLAKMPVGEAYFYQPNELPAVQRVKFRKRNTLDTTTTEITAGHKVIKPVLAAVDLEQLGDAMAAAREKAKADDPRELRRIIHEQRLEIQKLHRQTTDKAADKTRVEIRTNTVEWVERVPIGAEEIPHIRDLVGRLDDARKELGLIAQSLDHNRSAILKAGARQLKGRAAQPAVGAGVNDRQERRTPDSLPALSKTVKARPVPPAANSAAASSPGGVSDGKLTGPEQRVLNALAWLDAVGFPQPTKIQIGFVADYRAGKKVGGTFGNVLGKLRSAALIDYLSPGTATLTPAGRAVASVPDIEQTTEGLQAAFYARLDGPERRVLQAIVEAHPHDISKQDVGAAANYVVGDKVGGTFGNILGRLRSLGLIDYPRPGYVVALPVLFLEER